MSTDDQPDSPIAGEGASGASEPARWPRRLAGLTSGGGEPSGEPEERGGKPGGEGAADAAAGHTAPLRTWLDQRRALGLDRFDEVWEGEYHVAPDAHGRHGDAAHQLAVLLDPRAKVAGLWGSGPRNLGRPKDFRVPDAAYSRERINEVWNPTAAVVVEILSPGDESYAKFGFYHRIGVEEILIVDPLRRAVEWYGRAEEGFERSGASRLLSVTEAELDAEIDWPPIGDSGT